VQRPAVGERQVELGRHLVVQAGTGTGKSLAYLVPAILAGQRVVVATATKALQDQLATKDLPFLAEQLDVEFTWAVLKGRSNYLCLQRVREVRDPGSGQLELEDLLPSNRHEVERLATWAATTTTGDRAELEWSPSERAWAAVSVSSEECPGAQRCPLGEPCFAETARRRAAAADVVVVNTHLYGIDVGSGGAILPERVARLPGGARVIGNGANVVSIIESFPDSDNVHWNAKASEVVATAQTWQLQAYALCAVVSG